jgi:hypothetical protein
LLDFHREAGSKGSFRPGLGSGGTGAGGRDSFGGQRGFTAPPSTRAAGGCWRCDRGARSSVLSFRWPRLTGDNLKTVLAPASFLPIPQGREDRARDWHSHRGRRNAHCSSRRGCRCSMRRRRYWRKCVPGTLHRRSPPVRPLPNLPAPHQPERRDRPIWRPASPAGAERFVTTIQRWQLEVDAEIADGEPG